jgi:hypothetical protein
MAPVQMLILLLLAVGTVVGVLWFTYRHGRKVGDQAGYIRGYKEGQQSKS